MIHGTPREEVVIVVAGNLREFYHWWGELAKAAKIVKRISPTTIVIDGIRYVYPIDDDRVRGFCAKEYVYVGRYWQREDLELLRIQEEMNAHRYGKRQSKKPPKTPS